MELRELKKLSETEKFIMKVIYDAQKPVTCIDVIDILRSKYKRSYADTTVYTFLKNIRKKGYIVTYRQNVNYYKPCVEREEFIRMEIKNVLNLWFDDDKERMKAFIDKI